MSEEDLNLDSINERLGPGVQVEEISPEDQVVEENHETFNTVYDRLEQRVGKKAADQFAEYWFDEDRNALEYANDQLREVTS